MIPKVIHYCWFGRGKKPELAIKCIESWKKYCPNYEIKEWNEDNFDINNAPLYVKQAYEAKKYAFVTDYVRLYALYNCGGIYMDTDVEIIKPIDNLLEYKAFSGFESDKEIPTGIMASEVSLPIIDSLLRYYDNVSFINEDGSYNNITNVKIITEKFLEYGFIPNNKLQTICDFTLLPKDYLCPKDHNTGEILITNNTYTIHHFNGSWISEEEKYFYNIYIKYSKILPKKFCGLYCKFITNIKYKGFFKTLKEFFTWIKK